MTTAVPAFAGPLCPPYPTTSGLPAARPAEPDGCGTVLRIDARWLDAPRSGTSRAGGDDRGRTAVLRIHGEIDLLTGEELRAALHAWLRCGAATVVVDLRGVSFVDCAGLGLLAEARRHADRAGIRLEIVPGRVVARTAALLDRAAVLELA